MGSNSLGLGFNLLGMSDDPAAVAVHENIDSQCVVQLGMLSAGTGIAFDEDVVMRHETLPPIFNLALEAGELPAWLESLTITPTGLILPPIPGLGTGGFVESENPLIAKADYLLPLSPVPLLTNLEPGGFGHFSMPSTIYGIKFEGVIAAAAPAGLARFFAYVTGSYSPAGFPRQRLGKITLCALIQGADVFALADSVPDDMKPPVYEET